MQLYFQQLLPLSECDAEDGRFVGHMLMAVVDSKPKDLPHAIRTFANQMAMLRECCCPRIGDMLVALLSSAMPTADAPSAADDPAAKALADAAQDLVSLSMEQAAALGRMLASSLNRALILHEAVDSYPVLAAMRSQYVWFVPMLEVLYVQNQAPLSTRAVELLSPRLRARVGSVNRPRATSLTVSLRRLTLGSSKRSKVEPFNEEPPDSPFDHVISDADSFVDANSFIALVRANDFRGSAPAYAPTAFGASSQVPAAQPTSTSVSAAPPRPSAAGSEDSEPESTFSDGDRDLAHPPDAVIDLLVR